MFIAPSRLDAACFDDYLGTWTSVAPSSASTCPEGAAFHVYLDVHPLLFFLLITSHIRKFQQIRAQWERAQSPCNNSPRMVGGRKEKAVAQAVVNSDSQNAGPSTFRRKLSRGMSFISHPLSQRRVTPGRRPSARQVTESATSSFPKSSADSTHELERLLSPINDSGTSSIQTSPARPPTPPSDIVLNQAEDLETTPKAPVRSATMSMIPRPTRSNSASSSVKADAPTPRPPPPAFDLQCSVRKTSTKVPTPSPPLDGVRKCSSPRQYKCQHTTQQEKHIAAGAAFAAAARQTPSRSPVRLYTTSSLVNGPESRLSQPAFMMARKQKMPPQSLAASRQSATMKENAPTGNRNSRISSQVHSKNQRRESLVALPPPAVSNRRSDGPGNPFVQGKPLRTTPTKGVKRLSSHLSGQATPLTAKRVPSSTKSQTGPSASNRSSNASSIAQSRLMGPVNPPTPTRTNAIGGRPVIPRASTERDLQRRPFGTPSRLSSSGMSAKSLAETRNEVRLPRSSTFSHISRFRDNRPAVPPIPEVIRTPPPTTPRLALYNTPPRRVRVQTIGTPRLLNGSKSHLNHLAQFYFDVPPKNDFEARLAGVHASSPFETDPESSSDDFDGHLVTAVPERLPREFKFECSRPPRPFLVNGHGGPYADSAVPLQVRNYMPALWWAGRFQTRFDQWRMEAMRAELDPTYTPEGLLGQCKLSDDRMAACYVFLQLRDLCTTNKAADSLWEFEYKYRQDHKLLGTMVEFPRKHNENAATKQGAIGRAVRRLTPRKASLVNMLKGKGWNRADGTTQDLTLCSV